MDEGQLIGEVGIFIGFQLREKLLDVILGTFEDLPEFLHYFTQQLQVALLGCNGQLPVPLVNVGTVVVVEEVVLAYGPHIGKQPLADVHAKLL
ncbi:hypothetical protein ES703_39061 [subsurface metagenome]